jgi:hypothetical protein
MLPGAFSILENDMSGITGYCVVCRKFYATGHLNQGNYWLAKGEFGAARHIFICADCAPYMPLPEQWRCERCGESRTEYITPETPPTKADWDNMSFLGKPEVCYKCKALEHKLNKKVEDLIDIIKEKITKSLDTSA